MQVWKKKCPVTRGVQEECVHCDRDSRMAATFQTMIKPRVVWIGKAKFDTRCTCCDITVPAGGVIGLVESDVVGQRKTTGHPCGDCALTFPRSAAVKKWLGMSARRRAWRDAAAPIGSR